MRNYRAGFKIKDGDMDMTKGRFITFEGIEGSGKSTHCRHAADYLRSKGFEVCLLREPGGTSISEQIRDILLDKENIAMSVECELLLYNAARAQLVSEVIRPAFERGEIVLCDRFFDSTVAYQCYGGNLDRQITDRVNLFAAQGMIPDLSFLLDSDVERGLERAGRGDRMELKSIDFHTRVRNGFLEITKAAPERFCCIDEMSIEEGRKLVEARLDEFFA